MSFENKVVLVTGASSGIGAAIALLFAKEGADVAMVGRNQLKLDNVAKQCAKPPLVINADVTKDEDVKRIIEQTVQKFGKLDVLVNNAGMATMGCILDGNLLKAYDETLDVNLRAVIHITTEAAPYLIKSKGNVVNISSLAAMTTPIFPTFLPYSISKAALDHFTRGAALELASSGVRVNSVNPGATYSDFMDNAGLQGSFDDFKEKVPLKRISAPEEIADLVLYLASDKARGITGSCFLSDNGASLS